MTVAALYIDPRGPYPKLGDVDCWDEARDATRYDGPHPIVAHPPCGPWGPLRGQCFGALRDLGPLAVDQVRRWGGVLEHPAFSRLWDAMDLPRPSELPDEYGGWSIEVNQCAWGHVAKKPTWLYFVGVPRTAVVPRTGGVVTHTIGGGSGPGSYRGHIGGPRLKVCSGAQRRRTPPDFAAWLVGLARMAYRVQ
jgi:hypothetical protein